MEHIDEQYIDDPRIDKVQSRPLNQQSLSDKGVTTLSTTHLNAGSTSLLPLANVISGPTTSINLDQTLFQPSVPLSPTNSFISSRTKTGSATPNSILNEPTHSINASRSEYENGNDFDEHVSDENDALLETLSQSIYSNAPSIRGSRKWKHRFVSTDIPTVFTKDESSNDDNLSSWDKNFFILTSAGKPIYYMHGKDEQVMSYMGIVHTIINYFQLKNSSDIKTISSSVSRQKFAFLNRSPIILMAYSTRGETSNELINQLDFLHSYLLSSLSQRQVLRVFNKRENFDLRNFLESTDFENLDEICSLICEKFYPDVLLGALQCLTLRKSYRSQLHDSMWQQLLKESDLPRGTLLYGLIVAPNNKLCSVLRPRGHTLHTTDLHLLFCLIFHQFKNLDDTQELWVPICFPKFNSNGFLYCYIKFLPRSDSISQDDTKKDKKPVLVLISAQKDVFFKLKALGDKLTINIQSNGLLDKIYHARGIKVSDIPAPLIHHFIYKSKKHVQYVMPELPVANFGNEEEADPAQALEYEKKLMAYYQQIHNSVVQDDGNPFNKSTLNFIQWEAPLEPFEEANYGIILQEEKTVMLGLAWITPKFELYIICNNGVDDKNVVYKSAKKIVNWCRKHETRLFVNEGAIF